MLFFYQVKLCLLISNKVTFNMCVCCSTDTFHVVTRKHGKRKEVRDFYCKLIMDQGIFQFRYMKVSFIGFDLNYGFYLDWCEHMLAVQPCFMLSTLSNDIALWSKIMAPTLPLTQIHSEAYCGLNCKCLYLVVMIFTMHQFNGVLVDILVRC